MVDYTGIERVRELVSQTGTAAFIEALAGEIEADGTIVGYTVRLRPDVEEHRIRALTTIAVEGNRVDGVIEALRGEPAVSALHSTNGRWDIVAELRADSLEAFDRVLGRLRQLEGVSRTETSLLLSTFKL